MNIINRKKLIIIIILFTFIASIFIVYWLFAKRLTRGLPLQSSSPSIITPTTTPTISSQTSAVVGMKTYTNAEYGFEFQYPEDWVLKENTFESYYSKFNIWVKAREDESLYLAFGVNVVLPEFPERSFNRIEKTISKVIVDNVEGVKYEYEFEGFPEIAVILPFGQYKMILGTGGDGKQYPEEFNQILASFKFLK